MSIQRLKNADGSFLLSKILTDQGTHTFTVAETSGNVQVTASDEVTVFLGDGTNTLSSNSGKNFSIGASGFSTIAVIAQTAGTSVAMRLIGSQASTAGSIPSWMQKYGYVCGGYNSGSLSDVARYESIGRTWSTLPAMTYTQRQGGGVSNRGAASYLMCGDINGANYSDDCMKFTHSTESWSDLSSSSTPLRGLDRRSYFWSAGVAGYVGHGYSTASSGGVEKVDYTTETFSTTTSFVNTRHDCFYYHHTGNNTGYSGGGTSGSTAQNDMDTFDMTTETTSRVQNTSPTLRNTESIIDDNVASFTAGNDAYTESVIKIDYGSVTSSTVSYVPRGTSDPTGLSFEGYGLWHGGTDGAARGYVQSLDFATYTASYVSDWLTTGSSSTTTFGHRQEEAAGLWDI